ncbi:MAG: hypothetical protein FWE08_03220 [Oscillospiraceae bacterium]|nr:hypothetical protein [Oscillospiraceae bacterium]
MKKGTLLLIQTILCLVPAGIIVAGWIRGDAEMSRIGTWLLLPFFVLSIGESVYSWRKKKK